MSELLDALKRASRTPVPAAARTLPPLRADRLLASMAPLRDSRARMRRLVLCGGGAMLLALLVWAAAQWFDRTRGGQEQMWAGVTEQARQ